MGLFHVSLLLFRWKTTEYPAFTMACFITFLISALSVGYGPLKKSILRKNNGRLARTTTFFFGYLIKMIIMLLMMTMSAWANLAIALGTAFGFLIF
jgi:hypothetical protein